MCTCASPQRTEVPFFPRLWFSLNYNHRSEGPGQCIDGAADLKTVVRPSDGSCVSLHEDFALFRRLLWSSSLREDSLTVEIERGKDADRRQERLRSIAAQPKAMTPSEENERRPKNNRYIAQLTPTSVIIATVNATVSVVILPTFNAGREFFWLLKKLRAQQGIASLEIVIVDSGSKDDTVAIALEFNCRVVEIENELFSHSFARNLGADIATGQYLIFMVQDAFPVGYSWVSDLVKALLTPLKDGDYLAALSCAEHPRRNSELNVQHLHNSHYKFLGCFDKDKVGQLAQFDQRVPPCSRTTQRRYLLDLASVFF